MITQCTRYHCRLIYDDADRSTICPHGLIMPACDLKQKKAGLALLNHDICFAHQPDGPTHRVQSVGWNGTVTLHGMTGEFAPHLFVRRRLKQEATIKLLRLGTGSPCPECGKPLERSEGDLLGCVSCGEVYS